MAAEFPIRLSLRSVSHPTCSSRDCCTLTRCLDSSSCCERSKDIRVARQRFYSKSEIVGSFTAAYAWKSRGAEAVTASGTLEARNISIGSKVGGRITRVLVREGDHVEPNQLLVVFDSAELEGQLLQAQGRVEAARANLAKMLRGSRPEEIAEANAASEGYREAELAQAHADFERARTEEANAERELKRTEVLTES